MCGIVGMVARKPAGLHHKHLDVFEQLLTLDTVRGKDSVGAMTAFRNKEARIIKHASDPFNLFRCPDWNKFRNDAVNRGRFVIGHNRYATRGTVNNANAHPFVVDHIMLVHNGSIHNDKELTNQPYEVDSHAICHALAKNDAEDVIPSIDGAFALIWYDMEKERLFATRNKERPLSIVVTDEAFVFASESWMAYGLTGRRNDMNPTAIIDMEPGELFEFDFTDKFSKSIVGLYQPKKSIVTHVNGNRNIACGYDNYYNERYGDGYGRTNHSTFWNELEADEDTPFEAGESVPPEISALREALADKAKGSNVCALTSKDGMGGTKSTETSTSENGGKKTNGSAARTTVSELVISDEAHAENSTRHIAIVDPNFAKESTHLVKIWSTRTNSSGRVRWTGKIMTPGYEMEDCTGFLPKGTVAPYLEYTANVVVGQVQFVTSSAGGKSVFIKNLLHSADTPVHFAKVPQMVWRKALDTPCSCCERKIEAWEKVFTSVKAKALFGKTKQPVNTVQVVCPQCLIEKMPKGEFSAQFEQRYNAAHEAATNRNSSVQNRESVSPESGGSNERAIVVSGPSTVQ